jgi:hypothetical protein
MDCKVTEIEIVDSRNYEPIAFAYLNWVTYLKVMGDKQMYADKHDNSFQE